jgi:hypothetical protein
MTTNTEQRSARIYQFPVGGRAAYGGQREGNPSAAAKVETTMPIMSYGSAWYHDQAIQEAARAELGAGRFPTR